MITKTVKQQVIGEYSLIDREIDLGMENMEH